MKKYLIERIKTFLSKVKGLSSADKFEIFLKFCGIVFIILLILNLYIINISWWIVFLPIIIPSILIMKELGVFRQ